MRTLLNRLLSVIGLQVVPSSSGLAHAKDDLEARIYSICNDADERGIAALSPARRLVVLA